MADQRYVLAEMECSGCRAKWYRRLPVDEASDMHMLAAIFVAWCLWRSRHRIERPGRVVSEESGSFCGVHGDECQEFADQAGVEGSFEELAKTSRVWRCSGPEGRPRSIGCCNISLEVTADELMSEGWLFLEKEDFVWAVCPACGGSERSFVEKSVAAWCRMGDN